MAEYNLGRVAFFDKGAYSPEETYNKWDFVTTVDSTYLFIGTTPQIGKPVTDSNFWRCIANGKPATLAAAAADLAKEAANSAATLANDKAALAQSAADNANDKAALADSKATLANDATIAANNAATLANEKAALAQLAADNASLGGANNDPLDGVVINLEPGQYLSDVVQTITGATLENPVTINFYNHSKTVNWETFTEKIHWPLHVHLNFVGKINLWPNEYYPRKGTSDMLLSSNPTDKLFLGFSFDRTTNDSYLPKASGLPENVQKVFFCGLDRSDQMAASYQNLIDAPGDWGEAEFGLVRVNGSKADDARNDALYKKIDGVFIDVTPDFRRVDFSGCDFKFAYFYSANNQNAYFSSTNNQGADFSYANNQGASFYLANNQYANFSNTNNQNAYFNTSNNQEANFYLANNQYVNFNFTNNQGANFISTNNQYISFGFANNQGTNFANADNQYASFYSANNKGATFSSANNYKASFQFADNQFADFKSANLKDVDWNNVISIQNANFQNADLTGGLNLPERINTKAKWIAECGEGNVNAETIWIDGTSILS